MTVRENRARELKVYIKGVSVTMVHGCKLGEEGIKEPYKR